MAIENITLNILTIKILKALPSEIRKKTTMSTITTSIQYLTGALASSNGQKMKYIKIRIEKNISVFSGVMIVLTALQNIRSTTDIRINKKDGKVAKIKSILFLYASNKQNKCVLKYCLEQH